MAASVDDLSAGHLRAWFESSVERTRARRLCDPFSRRQGADGQPGARAWMIKDVLERVLQSPSRRPTASRDPRLGEGLLRGEGGSART